MTLRDMRKGKRITQNEMAASIGVTQAYICALEKGARKNPSLDVVRKIAGVLGVRVDQVIEAMEATA